MQNPAKSLIFVIFILAQVCRRGMASVGVGLRRRLGRVHESAAWVRESARRAGQGRKGVIQAAKGG